MLKRILPRFAALLFAALVSASAQTDMPAEKRALIRELLALMGGATVAEQITQIFLGQFQQNYTTMMQTLVAQRQDISAEERRRLLARLDSFEHFSRQFRAKFPQQLNVSEILDTVYSPLYDKYFNEQELKELIAFYRTPAGRKAIAVLPALMQEGMQGTAQQVGPRVMRLVQEIIEEERAGSRQ
jgi:uncharacterized protein